MDQKIIMKNHELKIKKIINKINIFNYLQLSSKNFIGLISKRNLKYNQIKFKKKGLLFEDPRFLQVEMQVGFLGEGK